MDHLEEEDDKEKVYLGNSYSEFAQLGDKLDGNPAKCKICFVGIILKIIYSVF